MPVNFISTLGLSAPNRPLDKAVRHVHQCKRSGVYTFNARTLDDVRAGSNFEIIAYFKDGLLHRTDGPAWEHFEHSALVRRAWALNGEVLTIRRNDYRYTLNGKTGCLEQSLEAVNFTKWRGLNVRKDGSCPAPK